jgi:hypothetical protein
MTAITVRNDFRALGAAAGASVEHEHEHHQRHRAPGRRAGARGRPHPPQQSLRTPAPPARTDRGQTGLIAPPGASSRGGHAPARSQTQRFCTNPCLKLERALFTCTMTDNRNSIAKGRRALVRYGAKLVRRLIEPHPTNLAITKLVNIACARLAQLTTAMRAAARRIDANGGEAVVVIRICLQVVDIDLDRWSGLRSVVASPLRITWLSAAPLATTKSTVTGAMFVVVMRVQRTTRSDSGSPLAPLVSNCCETTSSSKLRKLLSHGEPDVASGVLRRTRDIGGRDVSAGARFRIHNHLLTHACRHRFGDNPRNDTDMVTRCKFHRPSHRLCQRCRAISRS